MGRRNKAKTTTWGSVLGTGYDLGTVISNITSLAGNTFIVAIVLSIMALKLFPKVLNSVRSGSGVH